MSEAAAVVDKTNAPVMIHPDDQPLWTTGSPDREPDVWLSDAVAVDVAGTKLDVLTTPGHTWGAISLYATYFPAMRSGSGVAAEVPHTTTEF